MHMKKVGATIALTMIIMALCYIPPVPAETDNNVIINADGTVTPSTAPIQKDADTYILKDYFEGTIEILRNNTVFNGRGNTISCSNYEQYGVKLDSVANVTVTGLIIRGSPTGCFYGIALTNSTNCHVTNNTVTDVNSYYWSLYPYVGIYISGGKQNTVSQNVLLNNLGGMRIANTSDNLIVANFIDCEYHQAYGYPRAVSLSYAVSNRFYRNSFMLTDIVTSTTGSNNTWDNGFPNGGNYWSNYQSHNPTPRKINNTGVYDVAYVIDDENIDHYPLAEIYTATPPEIVILSKCGGYNMSSVPLAFTVDQPTAWMGYSLDGAQNATLSGNQTLTDLASGQHTVTVYANDSFGNMGSAEFTFTVSAPLSTGFIVGVFVVVLAVAVIAGVVYYKWHKRRIYRLNPLAASYRGRGC
jgi:parallel beta-helix repeat protein